MITPSLEVWEIQQFLPPRTEGLLTAKAILRLLFLRDLKMRGFPNTYHHESFVAEAFWEAKNWRNLIKLNV